MSLQFIELESVQTYEVSDEQLEASSGLKGLNLATAGNVTCATAKCGACQESQ